MSRKKTAANKNTSARKNPKGSAKPANAEHAPKESPLNEEPITRGDSVQDSETSAVPTPETQAPPREPVSEPGDTTASEPASGDAGESEPAQQEPAAAAGSAPCDDASAESAPDANATTEGAGDASDAGDVDETTIPPIIVFRISDDVYGQLSPDARRVLREVSWHELEGEEGTSSSTPVASSELLEKLREAFAGRDDVSEVDVSTEYTIATTMAPADYDGFGTFTLKTLREGRRMIAIVPRHAEWQVNRNWSGNYATMIVREGKSATQKSETESSKAGEPAPATSSEQPPAAPPESAAPPNEDDDGWGGLDKGYTPPSSRSSEEPEPESEKRAAPSSNGERTEQEHAAIEAARAFLQALGADLSVFNEERFVSNVRANRCPFDGMLCGHAHAPEKTTQRSAPRKTAKAPATGSAAQDPNAEQQAPVLRGAHKAWATRREKAAAAAAANAVKAAG